MIAFVMKAARHYVTSLSVMDIFKPTLVSGLTTLCTRLYLAVVDSLMPFFFRYTQAKGTFPYEISVLDIDSELSWNPDVVTLSAWPLSICDDGCLLYYRDRAHTPGELTDGQRTDLQQRENIRCVLCVYILV